MSLPSPLYSLSLPPARGWAWDVELSTAHTVTRDSQLSLEGQTPSNVCLVPMLLPNNHHHGSLSSGDMVPHLLLRLPGRRLDRVFPVSHLQVHT
jgi:hypothetical protein